MPLPAHALTVNGGCNCRAIRYKINIPTLSERPLHPSVNKSSGGEEVHLPMIAIDHCNDCRRATGSILPLWICSPTAFVSSSCVLRSTSSTYPEVESLSDEARGSWLPAAAVFQPGPESRDSYLTLYTSSEGRTRSFCGRCGTNLAYSVHPMPEGWPDMLDVVLGTIDREDLDGEALKPERHLWLDCGIDWVKRLATGKADKLPKHPSYKVNEVVE